MSENLIETLPNITPPTISSKYGALGVEYGYNPPTAEQLRLYLNGFPKEGKSTFVNSIPRAIVFDYEKGDISIIRGRAVYYNVAKWGFNKVANIIRQLIEDGKNNVREFDYVVQDTVDGWLGYEIIKFCEDEKLADMYETDTRRVWSIMLTRICSTLRQLESAGYGWIVTGHQRWEDFKNPRTKEVIQKPRQVLAPSIHERILAMSEIFGEISARNETEVEVARDPASGIEYTVDSRECRNYYFRLVNILGEQGAARGVPAMTGEIKLPLVAGWDKFKAEYERCVNQAKASLQLQPQPEQSIITE